MQDHLSMEELLIALKYCNGTLGGSACTGCPNAVPGSEDKYGACQCRFETTDEMIHLLENLINK